MDGVSSILVDKVNFKDDDSIGKFIKNQFGKGAYLNDFTNNRITVGAKVPRTIDREDVKPFQSRMIKFLKFDSVFEISVKESEDDHEIYKVQYPEFDEIERRIDDRIRFTYRNMEKQLLMSSKLGLVRINAVKNSLTPFVTILSKVLNSSKFTYRDIKDLSVYKTKERVYEYLNFLSELKYLRKTQNGYEEGNALIALSKRSNDVEIIDDVLSVLISSNYEYIYNFMRIYSIMPYIRLANAYYFQAWLLNDLIKIKVNDLMRFHKIMYPKVNMPSSKRIIVEKDISEMAAPNVGMIEFYDGKIVGNNYILDDLNNTLSIA